MPKLKRKRPYGQRPNGKQKFIHAKTASGTHLFLSGSEFKYLARKTSARWKRGERP